MPNFTTEENAYFRRWQQADYLSNRSGLTIMDTGAVQRTLRQWPAVMNAVAAVDAVGPCPPHPKDSDVLKARALRDEATGAVLTLDRMLQGVIQSGSDFYELDIHREITSEEQRQLLFGSSELMRQVALTYEADRDAIAQLTVMLQDTKFFTVSTTPGYQALKRDTSLLRQFASTSVQVDVEPELSPVAAFSYAVENVYRKNALRYLHPTLFRQLDTPDLSWNVIRELATLTVRRSYHPERYPTLREEFSPSLLASIEETIGPFPENPLAVFVPSTSRHALD